MKKKENLKMFGVQQRGTKPKKKKKKAEIHILPDCATPNLDERNLI